MLPDSASDRGEKSLHVLAGHYSFCSQYMAPNLPNHVLRRLLGTADTTMSDSVLYTDAMLAKECYEFESVNGRNRLRSDAVFSV
jgi:hypothetical protein